MYRAVRVVLLCVVLLLSELLFAVENAAEDGLALLKEAASVAANRWIDMVTTMRRNANCVESMATLHYHVTTSRLI